MVLSPVTLLLGEDTALRDEALGGIKESIFGSGTPNSTDMDSFTAPETSSGQLISQAATIPFLSKKRLLILNRVEKVPAGERESLLAALKNCPPHAVWVLHWCESRTARSSFLDSLQKISKTVLCKTPHRSGELRARIVKEFASRSKKTEGGAVQAVIEDTEKEWWAIRQRIEQVCLYAGKRPRITGEDVRAFCARPSAMDVFKLYESLLSRDMISAMRTVKKLKEEGRRPHEILGALIWQVDRNRKVRNLLDTGRSSEEIARQLRIPSYFMDATIRQARKLKIRQARSETRRLLNCDRNLKQGGVQPELELEGCLLGFYEAQVS